MSDEESTVEEWKTVRIPATSYYKLVELSGFLTLLLGSTTVPISWVAEMAVELFHDIAYGKLKKTISDADKLEAARKEIGGTTRNNGLRTRPKAAITPKTIEELIKLFVAPHKSSPAMTSSKFTGVAIMASKVF